MTLPSCVNDSFLFCAGEYTCANEVVRLLYVDYGNEEEVPPSDVQPIPAKFCVLPAQALFCSLLLQNADVDCSSAALVQQWLSQTVVGLPSSVLIESYDGKNHAVGDIQVAATLLLSEHPLKLLEDISGVLPDVTCDMVSISAVVNNVLDNVEPLLQLSDNSFDCHHIEDSEYSKLQGEIESATVPKLCGCECISEGMTSLPKGYVVNSDPHGNVLSVLHSAENSNESSSEKVLATSSAEKPKNENRHGLEHRCGSSAEHEIAHGIGDGSIVSNVYEQSRLSDAGEISKQKYFRTARIRTVCTGHVKREEQGKNVDQQLHVVSNSPSSYFEHQSPSGSLSSVSPLCSPSCGSPTMGVKDLGSVPVHSVQCSNKPLIDMQPHCIGASVSPVDLPPLHLCNSDGMPEIATPCSFQSESSCDTSIVELRNPQAQQCSIAKNNPVDIPVASSSTSFHSRVHSDMYSASRSSALTNVRPCDLQLDGGTPSFFLIVSHIESVSKFYVHPVQHSSLTLLDLETSLNDCYSRPGVQKLLSNVERGAVCCIQCPEDRMWYRAVVSEVWSTAEGLPDKCCAFFFDYGVSEIVSITVLKVLVPQFLSIPAQCICCSLSQVEHFPETSDDQDGESRSALLLNDTLPMQKSQVNESFSSENEKNVVVWNGDASSPAKNVSFSDSVSSASVDESRSFGKKQWSTDSTTEYFHSLVCEEKLAAVITETSVTSK